MSAQQTAHRPAGVSVPLSTKLVSTFAALLILGGLALAVRDKLNAGREPETSQLAINEQGESLPNLHLFMPGVIVLLVVVCLIGVYALSRGSRPTR